MNTTDIIALVALIISILSFYISWKNYIVFKKQDDRMQPKITLEINDSYFISVKNKSFKIYAFNILVSNIADTDNSIKKIELLINCIGKNLKSNYIIKIDFDEKNGEHIKDINLLKPPININAHVNEIGWILFKVDNEIIMNNRVDSYYIRMVDTHDNEILKKQIIMRELISNEPMA